MKFITKDQHKESSLARMGRDLKDIPDLLNYLIGRNPLKLGGPSSLRSVATGITVHDSVNCDTAIDVGMKILVQLPGKKMNEHSFKKKVQAITIKAKNSIKVMDKEVSIDSCLLFQRVMCAGTTENELPELFQHELCQHPSALFESNSNIRLASMASLADFLWCASIQSVPQPPKVSVHYVLDGGALLHKLPWPKGAEWGEILQMYSSYVTFSYGTCIVVFDGYANLPFTKDCAHFRRCGGKMGAEVYVDSKMKLNTNKEDFPSNPKNKQRLILMMGGSLERAGSIVHHARGDADLLIAKTAIATAQQHDTVVLGGDTDILILLIHYKADSVTHDIWLQRTSSKETSKC